LAMIGWHGVPKHPKVCGKWVTHSPSQQSEGTFIPPKMTGFSFKYY
jgi:hypothetical protein